MSDTADLTVIFLTNNELRPRWTDFQLETLKYAVDDAPVISVSRVPVAFGDPNILQTEPKSGWNVYRQMLNAATFVRTPYIGIAEDDTLYTRKHFYEFRPPPGSVAYNRSRWTVLSWVGRPMFGVVRKWGNFALIGHTDVIIGALEERMTKWPGEKGGPAAGELGRRDVETQLGVTPVPAVEWWGSDPIVNVAHPQGLSPTYIGRKGLKRSIGEIKAIEIPGWGRADHLTEIFNEGDNAET